MAFLGWRVNGELQPEPPKEWLDKLEEAFIEVFGLKMKESSELIEGQELDKG